MNAKKLVLLLLVATSPLLARADEAASSMEWAYPVRDPLQVLPPPVLANLQMPDPAGVHIPAECQQDANRWIRPAGLPLPEMTLQEAIDAAICLSPALRMNRAAVQSAAAALGQAKATDWPTVSASISRVQQSQSNARTDRIYATSNNVAFNWRVFDFGQRESRQKSQSSSLKAASATFDAAVQKTLGDLIQQYFAAQSTHALMSAREQNAKLSRRMLESMQNRLSKGQADLSETLQAKSATARAEFDLSVSRGEAEKARATLTHTLGLPANSKYRVTSEALDVILGQFPQADPGWEDLDAWLEQLKATHPAIVAARAQVEAAHFNAQSVKAEGLPSIEFSWNQYKNGRPNQSLSGVQGSERTSALSLKIPLFDGFSQTYKVRAAEAQLEQKKAELDAAEALSLREALFLHADAKAAQENLKSAQRMTVAALQSTESIQRKFDQGAADFVQLNQSLVALGVSQFELIKSWSEWQAVRLRFMVVRMTTK